MDRPPQEYAAAAAASMAFAQQQTPKIQPQQQQLGFHHHHQQQQQQQFPPHSIHHPPFIPIYPSPLQIYPFNHHMQPHHPPPIHLHHPHPIHHQQPPPAAAPAFPHPPQAALPQFWGPYDSAPPPAPPPPDPELQKRIEKLVEYAAKNGPEFESMIREKQRDNPAYGFLFGGEGSGYYYYKLWLSTRGAHNPAMIHPPIIHPPPPPPLPAHFSGPQSAGAGQIVHPGTATTPYVGALYDKQQPQIVFENTRFFKGLSGPLPSDVALELSSVLSNLTGTKESIKGAKMWFMQRSPFAPALAEALRDRFFSLEESERQLHIIYLANDILFDSLQRRANPHSLDNEALAFRPVLGPMLSRIYHNHQNREENQTRLQKILHFWGSKEVYDHATISELESEMMRIPPPDSLSGPATDPPYSSAGLPAPPGLPHLQIMSNGAGTAADPLHSENKEDTIPVREPPPPDNHFLRNLPEHSGTFPLPSAPLPAPLASLEKVHPYPLFPPGLIPGMVRKMQIGSGVPYSPMSPLDIPTTIPPSAVSPSRVLDRVSKFFREVGEVNPSEGPMGPSDGAGEDEFPIGPPHVRKGGARIPPPATLAMETDALAATAAYSEGAPDPDQENTGAAEPTQYDDVYTSYRKQRSTTYHSSLGVRAAV